MFASAAATDEFLGAVQASLLRSTYRLEAAAHPEVFEPARRAAAALGLDLPISIFQAEGRAEANAGLVFVPSELLLVLSGNLVTLLDPEELTAVFGHELAHHRLWTEAGGTYLTADRLLHAAADDPAGAASHDETARRYRLATELYADRGAFLAAAAPGAAVTDAARLAIAVAGLVKVATGLAQVSGEAYLRQAEQVVAGTPEPSAGDTHPENFIRATALAQWASGADTTAAWELIGGVLDIDRLDLPGQIRLDAITQAMIGELLQADWFRTDAVLGHAGQFSNGPTTAPTIHFGATDAADLAPATRHYLACVLLDFATVDPDLDDEALIEVFACAVRLGLQEELALLATDVLKLNPNAVATLWRAGTERTVAP